MDHKFFDSSRSVLETVLRDRKGYMRCYLLRQQIKSWSQPKTNPNHHLRPKILVGKLEQLTEQLFKMSYDGIFSDVKMRIEHLVERMGLEYDSMYSQMFPPIPDIREILQSVSGFTRAEKLLEVFKTKSTTTGRTSTNIVTDAMQDLIDFLERRILEYREKPASLNPSEYRKALNSEDKNATKRKADEELETKQKVRRLPEETVNERQTEGEPENIRKAEPPLNPLVANRSKIDEDLVINKRKADDKLENDRLKNPPTFTNSPFKNVSDPSLTVDVSKFSSSQVLQDAYILLTSAVKENSKPELKKSAENVLLNLLKLPYVEIPKSFLFNCINDHILNVEIYQAIMDRSDFNLMERNDEGQNILMLAAQQGKIDIFKVFFEAIKKTSIDELYLVDAKGRSLFFLVFQNYKSSAMYEWFQIIEDIFQHPVSRKSAKSKELLALIKMIPARGYLNDLKFEMTGKAKIFNDPTTLILENLSASRSFYDLSQLGDEEVKILSKYPVFKPFKDLRKLKAKVTIEGDGLTKWRNLIKLDPVTGIVYRSVNILILQQDALQKSAIEIFGCIVILQTAIAQNPDGISFNVSYKESQDIDWRPFQERIRLYNNVKPLELQPYTGTILSDLPVFEQSCYPKMLQVPVLARYDLTEKSAKNHYIYLSVDEFRKRLDENGDVIDSDLSTTGRIACLWLVAGGPGGKVHRAHKLVELLSSSILKGSSEFEEVRVLLVEHRGIGHLERLTIASRINNFGKDWERSRLLQDSSIIPVDQYGSTASAQDIVSVVEKYTKTYSIKAVHIGLGGSYASRTMQKAIKFNPEIFHTIILAGVSYPRAVHEFKKEMSGILKAMQVHPLFESYHNLNDNIVSWMISVLDNLDLRTNKCKSDLKRLYPNSNISDLMLQWVSSTLRKDLILLLALFYDHCQDEPLTKSQIDAFFRVVNEDKQSAPDSSGMTHYGKMLLYMIETSERFAPSAKAYYDSHCINKDAPFSHKLLFYNECQNAMSIFGHNDLPVEILKAEYKSIQCPSNLQSDKRPRVIIFQGNLDANTESYMAEFAAEDLTKDKFKVDLVFMPLRGHEFYKEEIAHTFGNFYGNVDTIFKKFTPFPNSEKLHYNQWYAPARDLNIIGILEKFDFEAVEVLLKLSLNTSYILQIFQNEEGLLEKYKSWFMNNSIANAKDLPLTMQMFQKLGISKI